jgi:hypothetical protein
MEIAAFKDKSCIRPFRLEYLELESLNFGFLNQSPINLSIFNRKRAHMRER